MVPSLHTLFLPLENGDVLPDGPVLFLGAAAHTTLDGRKDVDAYQPYRPLAEGLSGAGWVLLDDIPEKGEKTYALALVHVPKQVEEARFWLASALRALKEDGVLLACAANDAGGDRIAKWLKEAGLESQSLSKNKCKAVWARKSRTLSGQIDAWFEDGERKRIQIGDGILFQTQPGIFGWDKIDAGSRMLAECLPTGLTGNAADFGSGTGYLSHQLLAKSPALTGLYLLEADRRALDCSKKNLENVRRETGLHFLWEDLTKPVRSGLPPLDVIVMNPPFHEGKKTDAALGQDFIRTSAHHLRKGGRLFMVANAHLPYERLLDEVFARVERVVQENGFKIFVGVK